jgi:hypothetical protein
MPIKNGIQVVNEIQAYIALRQKELVDVKLLEPIFVFLTAFKTPSFLKHLISLNITKCYEKPVQFELLRQLIEELAE